MTPHSSGPHRFERFELRPAQRQLLLAGEPAALGARAFDLLMVLAERRDRIVPKNELLDLVWPGLVVEENNLQVQISGLRKLLGSQAIATVPGRGYRLTATPYAALAKELSAAPTVAPAPSPAMPATATNLPGELPPLYGRETELRAVGELLRSHRHVTLVGTGGLGKTRLALAAAHAAQADFADGVWLVELAPINDPGLVLATVARALGVPLDAQATAEQLGERLVDRQLLLVLDNCEHLIDGVAAVANALLRAAPRLHVLATSQEPMKLAGERVMRPGPLNVPPVHGDSLDGGHDEGALQLFEARVRALQPRFELNAANRAAAIDICRRLDGLPLAIELAAARVPLLGVDGLRQRLDDRFKLLTAGSRLAPHRQQTLRAALAWSHTLLSADEQLVFRRIGVFAGSFGLGAVQRVAADDSHDEWAVLDHLGGLVDKSLVLCEPGDVPRYRLLESGRAFALERLGDAGEAAAVARRHAEATRDTFEQADAQQWTLRDDLLVPPLLPEIDNLRAAVGWAAGPQGDAELLVALVGASSVIFKAAGLVHEGLGWCAMAIERIHATTPPALEARVLLAFAQLSHQFEAEREIAALHRAVQIYKTLADHQGLYRTLCVLAQKQTWRYDIAAAEQATNDAAALIDPRWPALMQEGLLTARTYLLEATGRAEQGQAPMEELVALMRAWGDPHKLDRALLQLAENLFVQGKATPAIEIRREVAGRDANDGHNLGNLSAALAYRGDLDEALQVARVSLPLLRRAGGMSTFLDHWALLAFRRGQLSQSALTLGCADAQYRGSGFGREQSEQRASEMVRKALGQALPATEFERLLAEGAGLSDEQAAALALGE